MVLIAQLALFVDPCLYRGARLACQAMRKGNKKNSGLGAATTNVFPLVFGGNDVLDLSDVLADGPEDGFSVSLASPPSRSATLKGASMIPVSTVPVVIYKTTNDTTFTPSIQSDGVSRVEPPQSALSARRPDLDPEFAAPRPKGSLRSLLRRL